MDSCDVHVGLAESVRNDSLPLKRFCKMQFPIMTTVNLQAIIDDPTPGHRALIPPTLTWSRDMPIYLGGEKADGSEKFDSTDVLPSGDLSLAK